jgi:hypothetical protein
MKLFRRTEIHAGTRRILKLSTDPNAALNLLLHLYPGHRPMSAARRTDPERFSFSTQRPFKKDGYRRIGLNKCICSPC